ncbi:universal stress protein [Pedobacter sp. N36a]|uniref:universal stress protein n=1 Tax=Pedobacter sp. N36a TaxID=2767996 RepID=UPI001656CBEB|nr:universal stress protein [Pedobacter sp. N36a]MBC8988341.1 universal stress protein [Pedobacter sp. N36a]
MKTILIPTDFSEPAQNAAYYALQLNKVLSCNLTLCHAFIIPSALAIPQVAWPLYEYAAMQESTIKQLDLFADRLKVFFKNDPDTKFSLPPEISCESEVGTVSDLIHKLVKEVRQTMVVMGMSGMGEVTRFFLGSISHHLINHTQVPILLIPAELKFAPIKRIAFATDFSHKDLEVIRSLTGLAAKYDADLVITNVKEEWVNEKEHHQKEHLFLDNLIKEINYSKIYIQHITVIDIDDGLQLLSTEFKIDMVVMVHKKAGMLHRLLVGSHTQTLAKQIKIPLLVIPENLHPIF